MKSTLNTNFDMVLIHMSHGNSVDISMGWQWVSFFFILQNTVTSLLENDYIFVHQLLNLHNDIRTMYHEMIEMNADRYSLEQLTNYLSNEEMQARYNVVEQLYNNSWTALVRLLELYDHLGWYRHIMPNDTLALLRTDIRRMEETVQHLVIYQEQLKLALDRMV